MANQHRAVVLSSGGIDSTTTMAIAKARGFDIYSLTFDYEQRHKIELDAARRVAEVLGACKHLVVGVELGKIGGSALTGSSEVPKGRDIGGAGREIPNTYVPARNTVFLALGMAWAEVLGATDIFIGVNAVDYSGYPDCRPEYIEAFEQVALLGTKAGVEKGIGIRIRTPLIEMSKAEIIRKGAELGVDYAMTHSCYDPSPDGRACGQCDSCLFRKRGFEEAGLPDPTLYY